MEENWIQLSLSPSRRRRLPRQVFVHQNLLEIRWSFSTILRVLFFMSYQKRFTLLVHFSSIRTFPPSFENISGRPLKNTVIGTTQSWLQLLATPYSFIIQTSMSPELVCWETVSWETQSEPPKTCKPVIHCKSVNRWDLSGTVCNPNFSVMRSNETRVLGRLSAPRKPQFLYIGEFLGCKEKSNNAAGPHRLDGLNGEGYSSNKV
jgi:hypothetical protein